jgi:5-methylcytosine-specific restriction endonuclease McrA
LSLERACEWCGADISDRRANARFCSTQHKKNAGSKRFRERNPGYYARYTDSPARVAWREANAERLRAKARAQAQRYREEHPEAAAAWWAANPEKHRLYQARRRAAKLSQAFTVTERDIRRLMHRYRGLCAYCEVAPATHLDHVLALKRGGRHSVGNLLPACAHCNQSKNARLLYPWSITRRLTAAYEQLCA